MAGTQRTTTTRWVGCLKPAAAAALHICMKVYPRPNFVFAIKLSRIVIISLSLFLLLFS